MIFRKKPEISLEDILLRIGQGEYEELERIMDALKRRYKELFPGWEVAFLSLPAGSPDSQREQARLTIEFIKNNWLKE